MSKVGSRLKSIPVKEEFQVLFEGDVYKSMVMQQMLYWTDRVDDFDKFIEEERMRSTKSNPKREPSNMELSHGWIFKSAVQLCEEFFMLPNKQETLRRCLNELYEDGYLDRRNNPNDAFDKVYQYKVKLPFLRDQLLKVGYILQGYKFEDLIVNEKLQNAHKSLMVSKSEFVDSEQDFVDSAPHFVDSYINNTENTKHRIQIEREEINYSLSDEDFISEVLNWAINKFANTRTEILHSIEKCQLHSPVTWKSKLKYWLISEKNLKIKEKYKSNLNKKQPTIDTSKDRWWRPEEILEGN